MGITRCARSCRPLIGLTEIEIERADHFDFIEHGVDAGEDNLVVKAVRAFERLTGERVRARIELFKNVPSGAGLGGGSADAAVTMLGLQRLYGKQIPQPEMLRALGNLGSDIPFFVTRRQGSRDRPRE